MNCTILHNIQYLVCLPVVSWYKGIVTDSLTRHAWTLQRIGHFSSLRGCFDHSCNCIVEPRRECFHKSTTCENGVRGGNQILFVAVASTFVTRLLKGKRDGICVW